MAGISNALAGILCRAFGARFHMMLIPALRPGLFTTGPSGLVSLESAVGHPLNHGATDSSTYAFSCAEVRPRRMGGRGCFFFAQIGLPAVRSSVKPILISVLILTVLISAATVASDSQSLAEAARKEAERRQKLEKAGVQEKRIEAGDPAQLAPGGSISTSSPKLATAPAVKSTQKAEPRESLRSFQTRLQKLDREITQAENRLKLLRAKADAERWAPIEIGKGPKGSGKSSSQDQMRWQILELEGKLAGMRRDRVDTFQAGRKAGYLPGELEGRGIVR